MLRNIYQVESDVFDRGYRDHKARNALQQAHRNAAQYSPTELNQQILLTPQPVAANRQPSEKGGYHESKDAVALELDSAPASAPPPSYSARSADSMVELDGKFEERKVFELA